MGSEEVSGSGVQVTFGFEAKFGFKAFGLCVVIGYKYGGGGYRVWDPRRSVVVESRLCSASCLLKSLSRNFRTATYDWNRTLTSALEGHTPYEVVYSIKPDLTDLCAFGTLAPSSSQARS